MEHKDALHAVLWQFRRTLCYAAVFSFFVNILLLAPSFYMMQVNDRVLMSRNLDTLLWLTVAALYLYIIMGIMEWLRHVLMHRFSLQLDEALDIPVFDAAFRRCIAYGGNFLPQAMQDLQSLRAFLTSESVYIILDLPWLPLSLIAIFLVQPVMGMMSLFSSLLLLGITLLTERSTRKSVARSNEAFGSASAFINTNMSNAEVMESMGMVPEIHRRWIRQHQASMLHQTEASDISAGFNASSKFVRTASQSLMMAIGMVLSFEIDPSITPGAMIIGSMLLGRALAPLDMATMVWNQLQTTRMSYLRIQELLNQFPSPPPAMPLPRPTGQISVSGLVAMPPGARAPVLNGVSFTVEAGQCIGIIGPSGGGKTTLIRNLVGVWRPAGGHIRMDGSDIQLWDRTQLGPAIGYLPQDVELFEGTIAQNIARFGEPDPELLDEAIRMAGLESMINDLPEGSRTLIHQRGGVLSGGQRQRIGLARAFYGSPSLIVLDEPNSNLDNAGEIAVMEAIDLIRRRRKTLLIATHRKSIIKQLDKIIIIEKGEIKLLGSMNGGVK